MYFNLLPDVLYPSLNPESSSIFDFDRMKNFFRRVEIPEQLFQDVSYYTKYNIKNNDRPDTVSELIYDTPEYDWIILLANNITDVYSEWPLDDKIFYEYLNQKYKGRNYNDIAYYETNEIKDSLNRTILPAGIRVDSSFTFTNPLTGQIVSNSKKTITYLDIETKLNDAKRNIFVVKPPYVEKLIRGYLDNSFYDVSSDRRTSKLKAASNFRI